MGIILLYATILIGYIITSIFIMFINKALGIGSGKAFIPIYNIYRVFKEYRGRVYLRNWGIFFLIIISLIITLTMILFILPDRGENADTYGLLKIIVYVILMFTLFYFTILVNILLIYPLLTTMNLKIIYFSLLAASMFIGDGVISLMSLIIEAKNILYAGFLSPLISISSVVFQIYVAYCIYKKVKTGEEFIVPKLDMKNTSYLEFKVHKNRFERKITYQKEK